MELEHHVAGIRASVDALSLRAAEAGLDTPVPTTPGWDVRRLVAHQGKVHRWAEGIITGEEIDRPSVEQLGLASHDPVAWLQEGADRLLTAIELAPADLDVLVFLLDAPPARRFWARRQCHETTIHAVDALAASLGRRPTAAESVIDTAVALDGIDEILTGIVPQPRSKLRSAVPMTVSVLPDDSDHTWSVAVSGDPAVTRRGAGAEDSDVVLRGSAAALYLTLWNRSDEVGVDGFHLWAELVRF